MFENEYTEQRRKNGNELIKLGQNPYSHNGEYISANSSSSQIKDIAKNLENGESIEEMYSINGRVMQNRSFGNLTFLNIQDEKGDIQIKIVKKHLSENDFKISKLIDLGDIVKIVGNPCKTDKGAISIDAKEIFILTKALSNLPDKHAGLSDKETIYRKPYLNMIVNNEAKNTFLTRSKIISMIRRSLEEKNSVEVETPILNSIPGGANAKPFVTHHNALGVDRYLRIAPELYLKRVIIGGIDRVFEVGKNFRNEGIDATHNPEFTSVEFYWAYSDYHDLMYYIEHLIHKLALNTVGSLSIPYDEKTIDLTDFKRIPFKKALSVIGNVPEDILEDSSKIKIFLEERGIKVKNEILGKLWEQLFDEFVEDKLINPTFITEYPTDISPLARRSDKDPSITERFELFIAGREIANGFNELNDPIDQYNRFKSQVESKDTDDEAMFMDQEFIEALMIGMPPVAGAGIGIDRLVMLLTNKNTIKDVILFPAMK